MNHPEHSAVGAVTRVGVQPAARDFYEGRPTDLPGVIRLDYRAIRELRTKLSKSNRDGGSNKDAAANREVLGMLVGSSSEYGIHIRSCELLGNRADLKDVGALGRLVDERIEAADEQSQFLGFFRTQPEGWPEVTNFDQELATECPDPSGNFLLVIQTLAHRPWFATLFNLADADREHTVAVLEFPFDESVLRQGYRPNLPTAPVPEGEPEPAGISWARKLAISTVVLAIAGIGGVWLHNWHSVNLADPGETRDIASRPFDLQLARAGDDFTISWDTSSSAIQHGRDGSLSIREGDISKVIDLNSETLRSGRFLYSPVSNNPVFRLQVKDQDGKIYSESVELLRSLADISTMAASQAVPSPAAASANKNNKGFQSSIPSVLPEPSRTSRNRPALPVSSPAPSNAGPAAPVLNSLAGPSNRTAVAPPSPGKAPPVESTVPAVRPEDSAASKPAPVERAPNPAGTPANPTAARTPPAAVPPPVAEAIKPASVNTASAASPLATPQAVTAPKPPPVSANTEPPVRAPEPVKAPPGAPASAPGPKIGGQVRPVELISHGQPMVYPAAAKKSRIQGPVVLDLTVGTDGKVKNVHVVSGNTWLTGAAADAVKQWLYKPAIIDGNPVESSVRAVVEFQLP